MTEICYSKHDKCFLPKDSGMEYIPADNAGVVTPAGMTLLLYELIPEWIFFLTGTPPAVIINTGMF